MPLLCSFTRISSQTDIFKEGSSSELKRFQSCIFPIRFLSLYYFLWLPTIFSLFIYILTTCFFSLFIYFFLLLFCYSCANPAFYFSFVNMARYKCILQFDIWYKKFDIRKFERSSEYLNPLIFYFELYWHLENKIDVCLYLGDFSQAGW